jgi:hypothetical protein
MIGVGLMRRSSDAQTNPEYTATFMACQAPTALRLAGHPPSLWDRWSKNSKKLTTLLSNHYGFDFKRTVESFRDGTYNQALPLESYELGRPLFKGKVLNSNRLRVTLNQLLEQQYLLVPILVHAYSSILALLVNMTSRLMAFGVNPALGRGGMFGLEGT